MTEGGSGPRRRRRRWRFADAVFDEALGLLEDSIRAARGPGAHQAAEDGDLQPGQQEA